MAASGPVIAADRVVWTCRDQVVLNWPRAGTVDTVDSVADLRAKLLVTALAVTATHASIAATMDKLADRGSTPSAVACRAEALA